MSESYSYFYLQTKHALRYKIYILNYSSMCLSQVSKSNRFGWGWIPHFGRYIIFFFKVALDDTSTKRTRHPVLLLCCLLIPFFLIEPKCITFFFTFSLVLYYYFQYAPKILYCLILTCLSNTVISVIPTNPCTST